MVGQDPFGFLCFFCQTRKGEQINEPAESGYDSAGQQLCVFRQLGSGNGQANAQPEKSENVGDEGRGSRYLHRLRGAYERNDTSRRSGNIDDRNENAKGDEHEDCAVRRRSATVKAGTAHETLGLGIRIQMMTGMAFHGRIPKDSIPIFST